ncbi:hypothetical protein [Nocardia heshunensis]
MNTKKRTARTGLAALMLAAAVACAAAPASADITLEPAAPPSATDIGGTSAGSGDLATGSGQKCNSTTDCGGNTGSATGSYSGSTQLVYPFSSAPVGNSQVALLILRALGYVPCAGLNGPASTGSGSTAAFLIMLTSGVSYDVGCAE